MKETINEAMKQDFRSHAVLGRVLFGISFLILGLYSVLNAKMFASNAPEFMPEMLAPLLVIAVGVVFVVAGTGIATGKYIAKGATAIAAVWALMAVFTNLFSSYFDVREFFIALAFVGAALMLRAQVGEASPGDSEESLPVSQQEQNHNNDGHHN